MQNILRGARFFDNDQEIIVVSQVHTTQWDGTPISDNMQFADGGRIYRVGVAEDRLALGLSRTMPWQELQRLPELQLVPKGDHVTNPLGVSFFYDEKHEKIIIVTKWHGGDPATHYSGGVINVARYTGPDGEPIIDKSAGMLMRAPVSDLDGLIEMAMKPRYVEPAQTTEGSLQYILDKLHDAQDEADMLIASPPDDAAPQEISATIHLLEDITAEIKIILDRLHTFKNAHFPA